MDANQTTPQTPPAAIKPPLIPLPPKVVAARQRRKAKPADKSGWWNLPRLRGSPAAVCAAVDAAPGVPDFRKAALKAAVMAACSTANFVYLDAHFHIEGGKSNYHETVEADTVLS